MAVGLSNPIDTLDNVEPVSVPIRRRWLRNRRIVAALILVMVGAGGAVVLYRSSGRAFHDYDSGPVKTASDTITSLPVEVGQVFTFGGIVLKNSSEHAAVLDDIRMDPPLDPGMTLVDVKVAGAARKVGYVGSAIEFPPARIPAEAVQPWQGAAVPGRLDDPEGRGLEILMGLRVNRPGEFGFRHVVVDYRIGGKQHRVRLNDSFIACAPARDYPPGCHFQTFFEGE
jgi:hypothetical protein